MKNQICFSNDITSYTSTAIAKLVSNNIFYVVAKTGYWLANGTISMIDSDANITAFINMCKTYNPNVKVLAWIIGGFGNGGYKNDVSTAGGKRSTMYSALTTVLSKGFDGIADDIEPFDNNDPSGNNIANITGTWAEFETYTNGAISACHTAGKLYFFYVSGGTPTWGAPDSFWEAITTADCACPMFYSDTPFSDSDVKSQMDHLLGITGSPMVIWLCSGQTPTLTSQQSDIDAQIASHGAYSKLAGFGIWNYEVITSTEWTNWGTWSTKNGSGVVSASLYFQSSPVSVSLTFEGGSVASGASKALVAGASSLSVPATATGSGSGGNNGNLGDTSVESGSDNGNSLALHASKFQAVASSIIQSISAYMRGSGAGEHAQLCVYADNSGVPGSLLGSSAGFSVTADGWQTAAVNIPVTNGQYIWLAFAVDSDALLQLYGTGSAGQSCTAYLPYGQNFYNNLPSTFPSGSIGTTKWSIYATYTTSTSVNYAFDHYVVNGDSYTSNPQSLTVNSDLSVTIAGKTYTGDLTVTAYYVQSSTGTFTVTITAGVNGSTNPAAGVHTYNNGQQCYITFTPNTNYML